MPISLQLEKDIKFISCIDPQKNSVSLTYNQRDLKREKKRSCFHNFLRWFIHIISFTLVPRNADLDKISLRILNNAREIELNKKTTKDEKQSLNYGIKNLLKIIRENGGRHEEKISKLLQTINKINHIVEEELGEKPIVENPADTDPQPDYAKKMMEQKTFLERTLNDNQSVIEIIAGAENLESLLNLLSEKKQAKLLLSILEDFKKLNNVQPKEKFLKEPIKYEKSLKEAIKLPIKIWKRVIDAIYSMGYKNEFFFITFFSVVEACKDSTHKWQLFDLVHKKFLYLHVTKELTFDGWWICMLSVEQRRRLGLEKHELPLLLLSAIKQQKLELPECREKIIKQMRNFKQDQKIDFLTFLTSINLTRTYAEEKFNNLLYFVSWLEGLHPQPQMLKDCIQVTCSNYYTYLMFDEDELAIFFSKLIKAVSYNILKNYMTPYLIKEFFERKWEVETFTDILNESFKLLKVRDARNIIDEHWNFIMNIQRKRNTHIFLRYIDDAQKLKILMPDQPIPHTNLTSFYDHFEKYPWKLYLLLDDKGFFSREGDITSATFKSWVVIKDYYPVCKEILFNKYHYKKLTLEDANQQNEQFQKFFALSRNNDFVEALQIFNKFKDEIKEYFLALTRLASVEELCRELPYINEAQLLVSLLDEESNTNMCQKIAEGVKKGLLTLETLSPILHLAINIKNAFAQVEKMNLIEKFLGYPIENYENENFKISKCYNSPTYSDMNFAFGNENIHVHRAFLSLDPDLHKYIPVDPKQTIIVNDLEEATKIKLALKRFYNFQMRDLILPRAEVKSLYNNQQAYPDFVVACGKEEIHLHRVMLATYLPFFQNMFNARMQEAQKSRVEIPANETDRFDVVKLVLEYVYTHEMPDFEDEASAQIFNDALDFYRPGAFPG